MRARFFLLFFLGVFFTTLGAASVFSDDSNEPFNTEPFKTLFEKAERGDQDSQILVATMYHNGAGIAQDYEQALAWYKKAADQGSAEGQHFLGTFYRKGLGVVQDYEQALAWYEKSAEQGDHVSMLFIGSMYERGLGVAQDYEQALAWYKKAADQAKLSDDVESILDAEDSYKMLKQKMDQEQKQVE